MFVIDVIPACCTALLGSQGGTSQIPRQAILLLPPRAKKAHVPHSKSKLLRQRCSCRGTSIATMGCAPALVPTYLCPHLGTQKVISYAVALQASVATKVPSAWRGDSIGYVQDSQVYISPLRLTSHAMCTGFTEPLELNQQAWRLLASSMLDPML